MATVKKTKKYQGGGSMDPRAAAILKAKSATDTTKKYDRGEMLDTINKITRGEIKPRVDKPMSSGQGTKKYAEVNKGDTTYMSKEAFEKKYVPKQKSGGKTKKYKSGGSFPDLNKDGKVTKADILKGRGVIAKKGAKVSAKKPVMKSGGTLSPSKSNVSKYVSNLNKAKGGAMMKKGGMMKKGC